MSMKAGGNRSKPGGGSNAGAAASGAGGSGGGRQNLGRGRHSGKGPAAVIFNGVYANMRMVHVLTSVVGAKCELKVKNGAVYEGVFKTYGPECDMVLDAAHRKCPEPSIAPRKEDIVESIIFKASDVVVVTFKDVDLNFARKVSSDTDNFTDAAVSGRINGEHKEKDLEPWDGGETHNSDSLESLDTDVSNGWDPNDMFKYNEEKYGVLSTYDSSLSTYTVPLERDNSEEFLKREARAAQLAEEIEASATYKARVALENDERSEEEKYTAVVRGERGERAERETHTLSRENKYIPPGQRNREVMSWGPGRQNSPRLTQSSAGPSTPRPGPHDYSPSRDGEEGCKKQLGRVLSIWQERAVYENNLLDQLSQVLYGEKKAKKRTYEEIQPDDEDFASQSSPTEPPQTAELIRALQELENAASGDSVLRQRISSLPAEVQDTSLLHRITDKESGERLSRLVEEACMLLADYSGRLAAEIDDRRQLTRTLTVFLQSQKDGLVQNEQKLEEYKRKLARVTQVRKELRSRLNNLPGGLYNSSN